MNAKLLPLIPCLLFTAACSKGSDDPEFIYGLELRTKIGDFIYRVNKATNTKQIGEGILSYETEGNFVILNLMVKNDRKKEHTLTGEMITYYYDDQSTIPSDKGIILPDSFYRSLTLKANETKTVDVVYEITRELKYKDYLLVKDPNDSKEPIKIYMEKDPA